MTTGTGLFADEFAKLADELKTSRTDALEAERQRDALRLAKSELEEWLAKRNAEVERLQTQLGGALEKVAAAGAFATATHHLRSDIERAQTEADKHSERAATLEQKLDAETARADAAERQAARGDGGETASRDRGHRPSRAARRCVPGAQRRRRLSRSPRSSRDRLRERLSLRLPVGARGGALAGEAQGRRPRPRTPPARLGVVVVVPGAEKRQRTTGPTLRAQVLDLHGRGVVVAGIADVLNILTGASAASSRRLAHRKRASETAQPSRSFCGSGGRATSSMSENAEPHG
jgi:hypothetical protein